MKLKVSRRGSILLPVLLVSTGCGSTLTQTSLPSTAPNVSLPEATTAQSFAEPGAGPDATSAQKTAEAPQLSGVASPSAEADSGGLAVPTSKPVGVNGQLRVGLSIPGGDPAARFTGGPNNANYPAVARALVADINARGGIAGRKVALTIATVGSASDYEGAQAAQEKTCLALTEDARSLVVLGTDAGASYATACYARHRTPVLVNRHVLDGPEVLKQAPWVLPAASATYSTIARSLPAALKQQGYISGKLAVVAYDLPALRGAVTSNLVPGLRTAGATVADTVFLPPSFTAAPSAIASAVLRFRREGIDHVVFLSGLWPLFAQEAQSQAYFPRYAITTEDLPHYSYDGFGVQPAQAKGVVGIGWVPAIDLSGKGQIPFTDQERRCWSVIKRYAGISYTDRGNGSYLNGVDLCEVFGALKAALDPLRGHVIEPGQVARAFAEMPASYEPTEVSSVSFAARRADYTGGYRWLAFGEDCRCFRYTSGLKEFQR